MMLGILSLIKLVDNGGALYNISSMLTRLRLRMVKKINTIDSVHPPV